jgi:hypothetical protein
MQTLPKENAMDFDMFVPLAFFGTVLAIVVVSLYYTHKNRTAKYRLVEKLLEQGQNLTPEMLENIGKSLGSGDKVNASAFGNAVSQILIGIGLAVFFWALTSYTGAPYFLIAIGVFPFVIGLSRLITIFYEKNQAK